MKTFLFLFLLFGMAWAQETPAGKSETDKTVQWGYKAFLKPQISLNQLKELRKIFKSKGVTILYPSDRDWKLPTGYLSLSSYLEAVDLEKLSPWIESVQSTEVTKRYNLQVISTANSQQIKRLLKAFTLNKIQVMYQAPVDVPPYFSVKTALSPEQIKQIAEIGPYIESIEG